MKVKHEINDRLKEMGLSQAKAARMADIPQSNFNLIVNGKLYPCPAWRKRIADVLQKDEVDLFPDCQDKSEV